MDNNKMDRIKKILLSKRKREEEERKRKRTNNKINKKMGKVINNRSKVKLMKIIKISNQRTKRKRKINYQDFKTTHIYVLLGIGKKVKPDKHFHLQFPLINNFLIINIPKE